MTMNKMLSTSYLFGKHLKTCLRSQYSPLRNINVSIVGAGNEVGSNLALLLKRNSLINRIELYDDNSKIHGIALELKDIPGGPPINVWSGDSALDDAISYADLIVMVYSVPRKPGNTREQMIAANAPAVQRLCRSISNHNPEAFLAIASNPINSMVPFVSTLLYKYNAYNPFRIFGITQIDTARARTLTARALCVNPLDVSLPVIGGHSDETIIPVFSNLVPSTSDIDPYKAETLTHILRKAGTHVVNQKCGKGSASLAVAASINDFVNQMTYALKGNEVLVNSYTANPNFGTRFFSGPTKVGPSGIIKTCNNLELNDYETFLLNSAIPLLNRDVSVGEDYVRYIETVGKN